MLKSEIELSSYFTSNWHLSWRDWMGLVLITKQYWDLQTANPNNSQRNTQHCHQAHINPFLPFAPGTILNLYSWILSTKDHCRAYLSLTSFAVIRRPTCFSSFSSISSSVRAMTKPAFEPTLSTVVVLYCIVCIDNGYVYRTLYKHVMCAAAQLNNEHWTIHRLESGFSASSHPPCPPAASWRL